MRVLIALVTVLALQGCAGFIEAQNERRAAQQAAWDAMTPQQQMVALERQRVAIEQQRANNEQIEAGLRMMQQPQFIQPVQPPINCVSDQYGNTVYTNCH